VAEMKKLPEEDADTIGRVQELAAYREDYIKRKGLPLSFKHTCYKMRISPHTVKRHAPELVEKWDDLNFHWERSEAQK
jgi:hypothetical protein